MQHAPEQARRLDASVLRRWAVTARAALGAHRESIDDLNVFPVPDADTGTNMFLTLDAAVEATLEHDDDVRDPARTDTSRTDESRADATRADPAVDAGPELDRFAQAALLGARGNSGVIVSQLVRGLVEGLRDEPGGADASATARAFERAAAAAYAAVTAPAEGTILSVARAAADAATRAASRGADLVRVVTAACDASRTALEETTGQLGALTRAGVVDAGGAGLVVVLEALRRVVTGSPAPVPATREHLAPATAPTPCRPDGYTGPRYEVMLVVDDGADDAAPGVREALTRLGDSVLLVGAGTPATSGRSGPWRLHVHTDTPDAVPGLVAPLGEPRDVVVTDLRPARLVLLACVDGPGLVEIVEAAGALAVPRAQGLAAVEEALGADRPVLVLPGSADLLAAAREQAPHWHADGDDVAVLDAPTDAHVLAAVAVHDPALSVETARRELADALAGVEASVCHDDTLPQPPADAALVTVVVGTGARADIEAAVRAAVPDAEVNVVDGADPGYVVTIGVER